MRNDSTYLRTYGSIDIVFSYMHTLHDFWNERSPWLEEIEHLFQELIRDYPTAADYLRQNIEPKLRMVQNAHVYKHLYNFT